jgi:RNA polymerase sigma factor (sigma-70 family)
LFDTTSFAALINRVRSGDQDAACQLVKEYESLIRREVRLRLEDQHLRRVFDTMDVCQSVLGSFFVRTALGEYDLDDPRQLVTLLVKMARNKVAAVARHEHRVKRNQRRIDPDPAAIDSAEAPQNSPFQEMMQSELLQKARSMLTEEELQIANYRGDGMPWEEIAATMGGTPQGRRMQLSRALDRVRCEIGFDE